jgi:WD40 repeat protein
VASGDVSGTVKVWDAIEGVNTKGKICLNLSANLSYHNN